VQDYSLYIVGRSGRLVREIEVDCANDDAAVDLARQWVDGCDVELWQLDRMIARFKSSGEGNDCARVLGAARF
jgi:hypothetical protein